MTRIDKLYHDKLKDLAKNPFQFLKLPDPTHVFTAYNPLCGDKYTFYLKVESGKIKNASFEGYGCVISKASSSVMVSKMMNTEISDLASLVNDFLLTIDSNSENTLRVEDYVPFMAVREFPERMSCVTLGWKELENQLKENNLS